MQYWNLQFSKFLEKLVLGMLCNIGQHIVVVDLTGVILQK